MAKPEKPALKPLIPTGQHTEFGELLDDPSALQAMAAPDMVYTPGWSDLRVARDVALGEVHRGERKMKDVPVLPGNVRLVRRSNVNGAPDQAKMHGSATRGYRLLTEADIGPDKMVTSFPPAATKLADGSISKGDCVYMICDQQQAARNAFQKARATAERCSTAADRAQGAGVTYESRLIEALDGSPSSRVQVT